MKIIRGVLFEQSELILVDDVEQLLRGWRGKYKDKSLIGELISCQLTCQLTETEQQQKTS